MALINYPAYDHLDEKTRQMLDRTRNEQGRIASFTHMMSKNPAVLEAALGQFSEVMYGGRLGPDLKQLAFVVHLEALRDVDFDDADVVEIAAVVAQAAFANTFVDVLGILPGDESADVKRFYAEKMSA